MKESSVHCTFLPFISLSTQHRSSNADNLTGTNHDYGEKAPSPRPSPLGTSRPTSHPAVFREGRPAINQPKHTLY